MKPDTVLGPEAPAGLVVRDLVVHRGGSHDRQRGRPVGAAGRGNRPARTERRREDHTPRGPQRADPGQPRHRAHRWSGRAALHPRRPGPSGPGPRRTGTHGIPRPHRRGEPPRGGPHRRPRRRVYLVPGAPAALEGGRRGAQRRRAAAARAGPGDAGTAPGTAHRRDEPRPGSGCRSGGCSPRSAP